MLDPGYSILDAGQILDDLIPMGQQDEGVFIRNTRFVRKFF
jgi:hypothetical protein